MTDAEHPDKPNVFHEPMVDTNHEDIVLPFSPPVYLAETAFTFVNAAQAMDSDLARRASRSVDRDNDEHDYSPSIPVRGFLKARMALRTASAGILMTAKTARLRYAESNFVFHASGVYTGLEITEGPVADAYAKKIVEEFEAAQYAT